MITAPSTISPKSKRRGSLRFALILPQHSGGRHQHVDRDDAGGHHGGPEGYRAGQTATMTRSAPSARLLLAQVVVASTSCVGSVRCGSGAAVSAAQLFRRQGFHRERMDVFAHLVAEHHEQSGRWRTFDIARRSRRPLQKCRPSPLTSTCSHSRPSSMYCLINSGIHGFQCRNL